MSTSLQSKFIETNGIKLHCKIEGNGKTVILLHGFPEFWYAWRKTIPVLAKEGFKVVAPDLRGYNKSDTPQNVSDYQIDILVDDIKGLIEKTSEDKSAILVAHDWGGTIAWATAMKYPELVDKLFILNSPHPSEFTRAFKRNIFQIFKSYYMILFRIKKLPEWFIGKNLNKFFKKTLQKGTVPKNIITDDEISKYVTAFSDKKNLTASINYYRALKSYKPSTTNFKKEEVSTNEATKPTDKIEKEEIQPSIFCPVYILWGCKDKFIGRELVFNTHKHCTSRPKIEYIQDASHWILHEQPDLVHNRLLRFLKQKHLSVNFNVTKELGLAQEKSPIVGK